MNEDELKDRTKKFGLRIMKLVAALPGNTQGRTIGNQLVCADRSVGANYRSACRARSRAEFISRLGVVEEEADESAYWMEMIIAGELMLPSKVQSLLKEANEIVAIMTSSRISASRNQSKIKNQKSKI